MIHNTPTYVLIMSIVGPNFCLQLFQYTKGHINSDKRGVGEATLISVTMQTN